MSTKLSQYCEGIMEAAWLVAVIVVPIFFNVFSSRIFEPDKIALLRTLALVILAAWIAKIIDEGGVRWERLEPGESRLRTILQIPIILPATALALMYLISTIFSVSPRVSLFGSYQRLQGTYTTFSYMVIFVAMLVNLRQRQQVGRVVTVIILSSVPVSLYSILQRYQIDPVPWSGEVAVRVAANMGNSIFVAAYLIMVSPLTIMRIVEAFSAILNGRGQLWPNFTRATAYVITASLQFVALVFSGSRGPLLGWLAGVFFLLLVLSLLWRQRRLSVSVVGLALAVGGFLVLFNIPNGPLETWRSVPGIGRLGQLLDAESKTGRVRRLIWQGAAELVQPHPPLVYPDGSKDSFNLLRPLIGYGPESMYVAYNPFYPPELAQVEKRNATPDRSHNETWDSLVVTGVLGLAVYLLLFGSVFYYGLKWLGLLNSRHQRNLFIGLYFGGGVASAVGFVLILGVGFFGVGLPFGMILGVLVYLILTALSSRYESPQTDGEKLRAMTLIAVLAAVVAHFVEINFGIAIAVTRTYFWTFAALLLLAGFVLPLHGEYDRPLISGEPDQTTDATRDENRRSSANRKKRRGRSKSQHIIGDRWNTKERVTWVQEAVVNGFLGSLVLVPIGYDFITTRASSSSTLSTLWSSMVQLSTHNEAVSYGMFTMVVTSWLIAGIVLASESAQLRVDLPWGRILLTILGVSAVVGLAYWLWHAASLIAIAQAEPQNTAGFLAYVNHLEALPSRFYLYLFVLMFVLAAFLAQGWLAYSRGASLAGVIAALVGLAVALTLAAFTNLRVIQADITFKVADTLSNQGSWPVAIAIYNRAIALAPAEDFYYLFLGRAYLESSRRLSDPIEREQLLIQAMRDLEKAQSINPLNTDHTANLARLSSLWASFTQDPPARIELGRISDQYYSQAVVLSPNNARLWDEWAILHLNVLKQPEQGLQRLSHSLEIDPHYDWTHALLGDYFALTAQDLETAEAKRQVLEQAEAHYQEALRLANSVDTQSQYSYNLSLAGVYAQLDQPLLSIHHYQLAVNLIPNSIDRWLIEESIGQLYSRLGEDKMALTHLTTALAVAPQEQKDRLQGLIDQLQDQP